MPTQQFGVGSKQTGKGRRLAKQPTPAESGPPEDFPQVPPRDLYPLSDIRLVIQEVAKLSALVDRLISDVKDQGDKIDKVRHQVTFVKGALWVLGGLLALVGVAVVWYFSGKLSVTIVPAKP